MEETNVWRAMDANKEDWRAQMSGTAQLRGIHVRRAKLLGLDAPTKLDVRGLYRTGIDEISAERQARRAVLEALPIEEQRVRATVVLEDEVGELESAAVLNGRTLRLALGIEPRAAHMDASLVSRLC